MARQAVAVVLGALTLAFLAAAIVVIVDSARGNTGDMDREGFLVYAVIAISLAGVCGFVARAVWRRRRTPRDEPRS